MDTIASISTPMGTGAIAIVRLSGKDSLSVAFNLFVNKKINKQKELLTKYIESSGFDLDELAVIANSKREYIKESEKGFNYQSINYAMYVGLQELKNRINVIKIRQEKQNQI